MLSEEIKAILNVSDPGLFWRKFQPSLSQEFFNEGFHFIFQQFFCPLVIPEARRMWGRELCLSGFRLKDGEYVVGLWIDTELMILSESDDKPQKVWKTFEQVIGCSGRSYAQWAAEHANDFRY